MLTPRKQLFPIYPGCQGVPETVKSTVGSDGPLAQENHDALGTHKKSALSTQSKKSGEEQSIR